MQKILILEISVYRYVKDTLSRGLGFGEVSGWDATKFVPCSRCFYKRMPITMRHQMRAATGMD